MARRTFVVLGGGGAMGAFQAGALLALFESGIQPDAFYGCSAGALNAAFLASRPSVRRAAELATWWSDPLAHRVLSPTWRSHLLRAPRVIRRGAHGLLDQQPLQRLIEAHVLAHDISELGVPLSVTTTCLDCGTLQHHRSGRTVDVLAASCALPGLFAPVRLADGHRHVDGGVLGGVPLRAALADADDTDRVLVLDCGLDPVASVPGRCAAAGGDNDACGLAPRSQRGAYAPPQEPTRGALNVMLRAFTIARAVANRSDIAGLLGDPRIAVAPHIADAWAAGLLADVPTGPRDFSVTAQLVSAGRAATANWISALPVAARLTPQPLPP